MSIWTKPLFEPSGPQRPLTEVEIRCARLRTSLNLDRMRWFLLFQTGLPLVFMMGLLASSTIKIWKQGLGTKGLPLLTPAIISAVMGVLIFWSVWGFPRVNRFMFDRKLPKLTPAGLARIRRSTRARGLLVAAIAPMVPLLLVGLRHHGLVVSVCGMFLVAGLQLLAIGLVSRRNMRLACARCAYPMGSWRAAEPRCTECGAEWKRPWGAVAGQRRVDRRLIAAAILCFAVPLAAIVYARLT